MTDDSNSFAQLHQRRTTSRSDWLIAVRWAALERALISVVICVPLLPWQRHSRVQYGVARDQGAARVCWATGFQLFSSQLLSKIAFWQTMTETPRSRGWRSSSAKGRDPADGDGICCSTLDESMRPAPHWPGAVSWPGRADRPAGWRCITLPRRGWRCAPTTTRPAQPRPWRRSIPPGVADRQLRHADSMPLRPPRSPCGQLIDTLPRLKNGFRGDVEVAGVHLLL
jgi:hypothetical protein